jgi:hypothetical protein
MKARILISFGCWIIVSVAAAHPIHVSIVNFDIRSDSNRIDFSVRLFYDDFQALINYKYNTHLDFTQRTKMTFKEQKAITDYIRSALIIIGQDDIPIQTEFKGWKVEDMSVWLYFCANIRSGLNGFRLENTLMLELFSDQNNMVIADAGENQYGFEFDKRNKVQYISLR